MSVPYPPGAGTETDPVFTAGGATDVELAAAVATLNTALAAKQASATAATDAELQAAVDALNATIDALPTGSEVDADIAAAIAAHAASDASDAELASAVASLTASIALKQDAATAATDTELADAVADLEALLAAHEAGDASDAELTAAVASLTTLIGTKQDAATAATDAEVLAHTSDTALDGGPHGLPALTADGMGWRREGGALVAVNIAAQSEIPTVTSGTADPSSAQPNGSTYYQEDAAGQTIAVWARVGGAWVQKLGHPDVFQVVAVATVSVPNNTSTTLKDTHDLDNVVETSDDVTFDPTTGETTIVRPGIWALGAHGLWAANATGYRRLSVLNAATLETHAGVAGQTGASVSMPQTPTRNSVRLGVGARIIVNVQQTSGSALNLTQVSFSARWVKP